MVVVSCNAPVRPCGVTTGDADRSHSLEIGDDEHESDRIIRIHGMPLALELDHS